jgi:hypothetical protein
MSMSDRLVTVALSVVATHGLMKPGPEHPRKPEVDRLIVRNALTVSDTGRPWEEGDEAHQVPRGPYARSLGDGPGVLWVRSRLFKGENLADHRRGRRPGGGSPTMVLKVGPGGLGLAPVSPAALEDTAEVFLRGVRPRPGIAAVASSPPETTSRTTRGTIGRS